MMPSNPVLMKVHGLCTLTTWGAYKSSELVQRTEGQGLWTAIVG